MELLSHPASQSCGIGREISILFYCGNDILSILSSIMYQVSSAGPSFPFLKQVFVSLFTTLNGTSVTGLWAWCLETAREMPVVDSCPFHIVACQSVHARMNRPTVYSYLTRYAYGQAWYGLQPGGRQDRFSRIWRRAVNSLSQIISIFSFLQQVIVPL